MMTTKRTRGGPLGLVLALALIAALAAGFIFARGRAAQADPTAVAVVTMADASFQPATVRIKAGESVTWKNPTKLTHTVTGNGFDSGNVAPGGSWSHTFSKAGSYPYVCVPHQAAGMKGTVIVTE